jgi:hypothetical protein
MLADSVQGKPTTLASVAIGVVLACTATHGLGDEETMPDEDLLEFLASWEEGDQDWLTIALEMATAEDAEGSGKIPGSAETDDENE